MQQKISSVYGHGCIIDHHDWNWFSMFHSSNMSLKDEPIAEHSSDHNQDALIGRMQSV